MKIILITVSAIIVALGIYLMASTDTFTCNYGPLGKAKSDLSGMIMAVRAYHSQSSAYPGELDELVSKGYISEKTLTELRTNLALRYATPKTASDSIFVAQIDGHTLRGYLSGEITDATEQGAAANP